MRPPYQVPIWKTAPLLRLLLPLIAGIILQWYLQFSLLLILSCIGCFGVGFFLMYFFSSTAAYYLRGMRGIIFQFMVLVFGAFLTWQNDSRHNAGWYGHFYNDSSILVAIINEPLVDKPKSFKAEASVTRIINGRKTMTCSGKLLLYFSKDSIVPRLEYGQEILINKPLQRIKNSGNPGAFDYRRYAAFQQLYHQVFLKSVDWSATGRKDPVKFRSFLFRARAFVLATLQKNIRDKNQELGIAEALLIGYKEDLDKELVQAYSNTGVVHIIAISGLHLGLIFFVLSWIFNRVPGLKKSRHVKVILLLSCLWLFSLLTGGSASVLRSAVMFTVIVIGKYYFRQSSIYSSLSASAFLLLCYNPYYLWDVGFQLSYLAVIGIVALQQPLYRLVYFKNIAVRYIWNMVSITVTAQVFTFPVCIYYFHQFPNLFLFTNLLTVPLSTIILFAEIFLVLVSGIDLLADPVGLIISWLIRVMNRIILYFDGFSFSVTDQVYADLFTTWFLYAVVIFGCAWLMDRKTYMLRIALVAMVGFSALHAAAKIRAQQQRKIVFYNVPRHRAVDFIDKENYVFAGETALRQNSILQDFHLKPARLALQATQQVTNNPAVKHQHIYWQFYNKKLLFLDSSLVIVASDSPVFIDILLLSHNPRGRIADLQPAITPAVIVFDASNSFWKIESWKKECEELNLRFHSVPEQGAFISEIRE
jgi:competence protein ComEC